MNLTCKLIVLLSVILFSCSDPETILPVNDKDSQSQDLDEKPITDSGESGGIASISFLIEDNGNFETNSSISFTTESENILKFNWDFGDGTTSTKEHAQHSYTVPGKYIVTLIGETDSGEQLSFSKKLFVRENGSELDVLFINTKDSTLNYIDISSNTITPLYKVPFNPGGVLALDEDNQKVYYYDYNNGLIIENNLRMNAPVSILTGFDGVSDMEFDQTTGDLFIALRYTDEIIKYNPLTPSLLPIINSVDGGRFGKIRDMDFKSGILYTITPTSSYESIFAIDVARGAAEQALNYKDAGYGYGIAIDDRNDNIYFNNVEQTGLMRSNLDGSNVERVINLDRDRTVPFDELCLTGMKVVETRNLLMWSSWGKGALHSLDLETGVEEIIDAEGLYGKFIPFENSGFVVLN